MANRIQGITVEINGDTTQLSKALESVNKNIRNTQSQLKDVERLLKLDPTNAELLAQKQTLLTSAVSATSEKLEALRSAAQQAQRQLERDEISQQQFNALQREIIATEQSLQDYQRQLEEAANSSDDLDSSLSEEEAAMATAQKSLSVSWNVGSLVPAGGASVVNNYYNNDNSRTVNQTNNSPKALSRLEIYRMTRNALNV